MRLGWKWGDRKNKRKNALSISELVLPTNLIVIPGKEIASFLDLAVNYHIRAIVNQSY